MAVEPGCYTDPELRVIDGDSVAMPVPGGEVSIRLLGFDAPERGSRARCLIERMTSALAVDRLERLLAQHEAILCLPGTECGFGRPCGFLAVQNGRQTLDVGSILIADDLAVPYAGDLGNWCQ